MPGIIEQVDDALNSLSTSSTTNSPGLKIMVLSVIKVEFRNLSKNIMRLIGYRRISTHPSQHFIFARRVGEGSRTKSILDLVTSLDRIKKLVSWPSCLKRTRDQQR